MRLNDVPMQLHPDTVPKTPEHTRRRRGPWWSRVRSEAEAEERRRLEEAEVLAAMAQRPVLLLNGREPDCMSGQCLDRKRGRPARSEHLAYALSGGQRKSSRGLMYVRT